MSNIKTISLWQPWASLIALGEKTYETRSWTAYHCGAIAIHAAKKRDWGSLDLMRTEPFRSVLAKHGITTAHQLPFGCVVALARIAACHPVEGIRDRLSEQERAFGDYREGRKAWELRDVKPLKEPIDATGAQGLWDWAGPPGLLENYLQTVKGNVEHGRDQQQRRRRHVTRPIPDARDD